MATIVNIILSILSFILAVLSLVFVMMTLKQNNRILEQGQKQIEESHNQFVESKRLECQPFLQMELVTGVSINSYQYMVIIPIGVIGAKNISAICKIKNTGNGTATNITYSWKYEELNDTNEFPINAIMRGDEYGFRVELVKEFAKVPFSIILLWEFGDILGNTYEQRSILHYEHERLAYIENDSPKFLGMAEYRITKKD